MFTPNRGKTAKGAKFTKPVKITKANINCKLKINLTKQADCTFSGPPKKKLKKTFKQEVASWTMAGCKKLGKLKCNFQKPAKNIIMHFSSKLEFKCGAKTVL